MSAAATRVFNAMETARLLAFPDLVAAISAAANEYGRGLIQAPDRQVVKFPHGGLMLSMPAAAADIGIHKLVNVVPENRPKGIPTINGIVSVYDGITGQTRLVMDGPTVTARRTAALSMLGLLTFLAQPPQRVALIGTGAQAYCHAEALGAIFPGIEIVAVARSAKKSAAFAESHHKLPVRWQTALQTPDDVDAVITLTTSSTPVYDHPAKPGLLVIGVGAFKPDCAEIASTTVLASQIYVDDPVGALHEAGDIILAGVDWATVRSLHDAQQQRVDFNQPIIFKTVGCAAWDLAAARCALAQLA
jgi:1-piperideine-2-carboxylate/1-pyrroline-2-carboxylate reductase [NAD(P)H]